MATQAAWQKTVRLGRIKSYDDRLIDVFCRIEFDSQGELHITGVEGPKRNGDAWGSAGQIDLDPARIMEYAPGWTIEQVLKLWDIWQRWHLNHMRAGCEHQRSAGWGQQEITLYTYQLNTATIIQQGRIRRSADARLARGETVTLTPEEQRMVNLPFTVTTDGDADRSPDPTEYSLKSTSKKHSGHTYEHEHPLGVLKKPCPTCGYEYGTAWLKEEVPADVLRFLYSLPSTDKQPAWV